MSANTPEGEFVSDIFDPEVVQAAEDAGAQRNDDERAAVEKHMRVVKSAYAKCFVEGNGTPADAMIVMQDLAFFGQVFDETFMNDARQAERYAGRRDVFRRIKEYTGLDLDTIMKRYYQTQS